MEKEKHVYVNYLDTKTGEYVTKKEPSKDNYISFPNGQLNQHIVDHEILNNYVKCSDCKFCGKDCKRSNGIFSIWYTPICCDFEPSDKYVWLKKNWKGFDWFWKYADHTVSERDDRPTAKVKVYIKAFGKDEWYYISQNDWVYGNLFDGNKLRVVAKGYKYSDPDSPSGYNYSGFMYLDGITIPNYTPTKYQTQKPKISYPDFEKTPLKDPFAPPDGCDADMWYGNKPNFVGEYLQGVIDTSGWKYYYKWSGAFGEAYTNGTGESRINGFDCGDKVCWATIHRPHRTDVKIIGEHYYIERWLGSHIHYYTNDQSHFDFLNRTSVHQCCFEMEKEKALKILENSKENDSTIWQMVRNQVLDMIESEEK